MAQVNAHVGDISANAHRVLEWSRRAAEAGAHLVLFPEMVLTGYPVEDLALRQSFVEASREALGECGYTFRSTNVDDLAEKLAHLVEHPDLVRAERDKGIARVKREYDWETVVDRFEELYTMPLQ